MAISPSIHVFQKTVEKICDLARDSAPKEFLAFLEGKLKKDGVLITDIIFQRYIASEVSALPFLDLPMINNVIGSIHSHPTGPARPSSADKEFFTHFGGIHFIIGAPFTVQQLRCFDQDGKELQYRIDPAA